MRLLTCLLLVFVLLVACAPAGRARQTPSPRGWSGPVVVYRLDTPR